MGNIDNKMYFAIHLAKEAHKGQQRKYTEEPYLSHPLSVMGLVASVETDKDMLIAAILHDVVEDSSVSISQIRNHFGSRVAVFVENLTDISKPSDGNREQRKAIDREHTSKACKEAKTIKLADLIDNTKTIVALDKKFAKIYMEEKKLLLEVLKEGDETLYKLAKETVDKYFEEENS